MRTIQAPYVEERYYHLDCRNPQCNAVIEIEFKEFRIVKHSITNVETGNLNFLNRCYWSCPHCNQETYISESQLHLHLARRVP